MTLYKKTILLSVLCISAGGLLFWFFKTYTIISQEHIFFVTTDIFQKYAHNSQYVWNSNVSNGAYSFLAPLNGLLIWRPLSVLAMTLNYPNIFQFFLSLALVGGVVSYFLCFKSLVSEKTVFLLLSFFYILNPWVLERVISGHDFFILCLPLFPIIIFTYYNYIRTADPLYLLVNLIVSGIAIIVSIQYFLVILLALMCVAFFLITWEKVSLIIFFYRSILFFLPLLPALVINYINIQGLIDQTTITTTLVTDAKQIGVAQKPLEIFTFTNGELHHADDVYLWFKCIFLLPILATVALLLKRKKNPLVLYGIGILLIIFSLIIYSQFIYVPLFRDITKLQLLVVLISPFLLYSFLTETCSKTIQYAVSILLIIAGVIPYLLNPANNIGYVRIPNDIQLSYNEFSNFNLPGNTLYVPYWPDVRYIYGKTSLTATDFVLSNIDHRNIYITYNNYRNLNDTLIQTQTITGMLNFVKQFDVLNIVYRKDIIYTPDQNTLSFHDYFLNNYRLTFSNSLFDVFSTSSVTTSSVTNVDYVKQISPVKYVVGITNLVLPRSIELKETFNPGWHIYIQRNNTDTSKQNDYDYLFDKSSFQNTHRVVSGYANGWTVDLDYIKQSVSRDYYSENPDGSINVELVLYFKPQSYFYLGLVISVVTLSSFFGCLVWMKCRRNKITKAYNIKNKFG